MAKSLKDLVREARSRIQEVSPHDLQDAREHETDMVLIDVREPAEFERRRLPGALLIPRGTLEASADPDYRHHVDALCNARNRRVVLYCQSGGRSAMAADVLQQMGFEDVWSLAGGIELWTSEGYETVSGPT
ncbi:MAG: rhodanese-like domain-containing protein [Acidiferrobacteraceae bacterium]